MPEALSFYALSGLAVVASALVIGQRNPMYQRDDADRVVRQAGGPLYPARGAVRRDGADHHLRRRDHVLFLFVVMLLNAPQEDAAEWDRLHPLRRPGIARVGAVLARCWWCSWGGR